MEKDMSGEVSFSEKSPSPVGRRRIESFSGGVEKNRILLPWGGERIESFSDGVEKSRILLRWVGEE